MFINLARTTKNAITAIFITVLSGLLLLVASNALAFDLKELSLDAKKFFPGGVQPTVTQNGLPDRTLGYGFDLNVKSYIIEDWVYWDSTVLAMTDAYLHEDGSSSDGQFRMVGLEMRLGLQLTDDFRIGYYHLSEHVLDSVYAYGPWPRMDAIEVKFNLYKAK